MTRRLAGQLMMRRQPLAVVLVLAWSLGTPPLRAETLAEAVADAYRSNPQLEAQRAELRALDESVIQAMSPYRLGATINGNIGYNERQQRGISSDDFTVFEQRSLGAALTITQLLTSGGRTAAQVSAAEADVLGGRERLREMENSILAAVIDAYVSVRRDQQLVEIQATAVANYDRQVAQNRSRQQEGDLAATDVVQAEAQLLIIRAALAQARANLEQSRSRFATVVGHNPGLLDPEPRLPGVPASSEAAQVAASEGSPLLWQAIMAERASRDRIAAARAERNPSVSANASVGYVNPAGFQTRDLGSNAGAGITFLMPILTQGVVGSRVRSALATQQSAAFRIEDARRTVAAGILNAWNQIVTAQEQLRVGMAAVTAAEAALGGVRRGFAEGFRSNFEVIDSEQRLLNAQVLVVNARYSLYAGQTTILAFIGRLQGATMLEGVRPYDATANLRRRRKEQIGPFVPIVRAYDSLSVPRGTPRPASSVGPIVGAEVPPVAHNAPDGPLATSLPDLPHQPAARRRLPTSDSFITEGK